MTLVLGIDSSTQSTKALLVDADTGEIVEERRASHPDGTEINPQHWLNALDEAAGPLLERAEAVAVGGQQHGMVALDSSNNVVRDALLWNDTRSAQAALDLIEELGGPEAAAKRTGSVHVASYTATKLRWMRDNEPGNAKRTACVVLPHDYINHALDAAGGFFTDRGDASGTAYFSPALDGYDEELKTQALGHEFATPRIASVPNEAMGETRSGALIAPGTGDNMAAALGLGLGLGDASVSIGTSGVAAMVSEHPSADPSGAVSGFADTTGRWLPLACTLNASRILDFGCQVLGVGYDELDALALAGEPGARGAVFIPYLDGERTPNRPNATGSLVGLTRSVRREDMARAFVEGMLCSLADAVTFIESVSGSTSNRLLFIGGGIKSKAVKELAPTVLGRDIVVPTPGEYVALGAAKQAAWALKGGEAPPEWELAGAETYSGAHAPHVLESYREVRERVIVLDER